MVVFDATILIALIYPNATVPRHPDTNHPVAAFRERIEFLVKSLEDSQEKIVIPTPALSEILVRAESAGPKYLRRIRSTSVFLLASFDDLCAVEVAEISRDAIATGDKRGGQSGTWAKVKYDRQIIAIAKVKKARVIYSDDREIYKLGKNMGLKVVRIADLPLPPQDAQGLLDLDKEEPEDAE